LRQRLAGFCVAASLLAGCAGAPPKPVLYPNGHLQTVGQVQADRDIAECRQLALSSGVAEKKSGEVGKQAAGGAAIGGASAGAWGLVRGNPGQNAVGRGRCGAWQHAVGGDLAGVQELRAALSARTRL